MPEIIVADKAITISSQDFITIQDSHARSTAILFAKFINSNGYREYDESDKWTDYPISRKVFTTSVLYEMFLEDFANKMLEQKTRIEEIFEHINSKE